MEEGDKKIVMTGHISLDITPVFQNSGKQKLFELFRPGKLFKMGKATMCTGGIVFNAGLELKHLGANMVLMARISDDHFRNALRNMISAHGCESCISQAPGENTSYTIVLAPKGLGRFSPHDPDCNNTFDYADVDFGKVGEAAHFHSGYSPIMRRFYLDDEEELVRPFKKIKSMGLTTSPDLVVVGPDPGAVDMDWAKMLGRVLPYVDLFAPSIEELGYMLDRPLYCKWQETAEGGDVTGISSFEKDVELLITRTLPMGTRCVLLRCGAAGTYSKTAPESAWKEALPGLTGWNDTSHPEDSYVPDCILSGTGARNTGIAALMKAMLNGYGPPKCARLAAAIGASCITTYDALSGLLFFKELRQKMEAGQEKQSIIRP